MTLIPEHISHKDADTLLKHLLTKSQNRTVHRVIDILAKDFQDAGELLLVLEFIAKELNLNKLSQSLLDERILNPNSKNIELVIQGGLSNSIIVLGSEQNQLYLDALGNTNQTKPNLPIL